MRNALLMASGVSKPLGFQSVSLIDILNGSVGLSVNAQSETYAAANQVTLPGDGKRYDFKTETRKVKSISANFRYALSTANLSAFYIAYAPSGGSGTIALGLYDDNNAVAGFKLVDDTHTSATQVTTAWNGKLTKTFATPVQLSELYVKVGGRSGFGYSPIYVKDLVIEYA